ncbi:hypothetical protein DENSPDRAFT_62118 [Dentipellis sp. KUC8613]|nr:hypothetical protein DENSPDRAFT_62118 [Dentipellis sp. KUC8613]
MDGTASVATIAEQIVVALQQNRVVTYFDLNASALLLYDYFLNLPDEIDLIWNSRWNAVKVTYLLNRCISFGNIAIGIYHQLGFDMSASICHRVYTITGWLITCGIATSELMLVYRTFALWGNEKRIGYALGLMFIGTRIASGIYLYKALRSMEFIPIGSLSPELRGCFPTKIDNIIYICWSIDLAYETVIMGLTFVKALQNFRRTSSSLLYMIFRDSTLSYITFVVPRKCSRPSSRTRESNTDIY